ncbi:hypothetical protein HK104_001184 [Borealophlyctis nickersoniae]|nr:hypothetical protein HK104_001184 [Borealophlyctis nickersoniae]
MSGVTEIRPRLFMGLDPAGWRLLRNWAVAESVEADRNRKVIPIMVNWNQGGRTVYITGTFNNWKQKIRLARSNADFTTVIDMPPGTHRFKFIVDDEWKCSEDLPMASDSDGNLVNYLEVIDETGERQGDGLDGLARYGDGYVTPCIASESPPESYTSEIPSYLFVPPTAHRLGRYPNAASSSDSPESSDITPPASPSGMPTEPPPHLPPHLERVLLNSNVISKEDPSVLPVPNHVTLNHLYACSIRDGVMALACTTRYKKKYVTTVLYKPVFN